MYMYIHIYIYRERERYSCMYMYIYIYIYIYAYTCVYVYVDVYVYNIYIYIYIFCIYVYMYRCVCIYIYIYICVRMPRWRGLCRMSPSARSTHFLRTQQPHWSSAIREMEGAPRSPAPKNHFLVRSVKPSGCHCTDGHFLRTQEPNWSSPRPMCVPDQPMWLLCRRHAHLHVQQPCNPL